MVDKNLRILKHSEGIEILTIHKTNDDLSKIKNDLFNSLSRVTVQNDNVFNEYFVTEGTVINNNKLITIKYDNNNHQWCSLARSI
jgi:hypothetical protein